MGKILIPNERIEFSIEILWKCDHCKAKHSSEDGIKASDVIDYIKYGSKKVTEIRIWALTTFDADILENGSRLVRDFRLATYTADDWEKDYKGDRELIKKWSNRREIERIVIEEYNKRTGRQLPLPKFKECAV